MSSVPTPNFPDIRVNHTGVNAILEPLTALSSHSEESPVPHDLGLQLSLRRGFETLLSLQTLQHVGPFPHQIRTAERILRHMNDWTYANNPYVPCCRPVGTMPGCTVAPIGAAQ